MSKTRTALSVDVRWLKEASFSPPFLLYRSRISERIAGQSCEDERNVQHFFCGW